MRGMFSLTKLNKDCSDVSVIYGTIDAIEEQTLLYCILKIYPGCFRRDDEGSFSFCTSAN